MNVRFEGVRYIYIYMYTARIERINLQHCAHSADELLDSCGMRY